MFAAGTMNIGLRPGVIQVLKNAVYSRLVGSLVLAHRKIQVGYSEPFARFGYLGFGIIAKVDYLPNPKRGEIINPSGCELSTAKEVLGHFAKICDSFYALADLGS